MIRNSININNNNNLLRVFCLPRKYGEARLVRGGYFLHYLNKKREKNMKMVMIFLAIPLSLLMAQDSTSVNTQQGTLVVFLTDLPNDDGVVLVALTNSKENYEIENNTFLGDSAKIVDGTSMVEFENIPFGTYAIKVFHDENEDGNLDTNFLGIPSEAYGFSNNATGSFGPAAWEDAKFTFLSQRDTLSIRVE